eukprot:2667931-Amphidinium_carterae.1
MQFLACLVLECLLGVAQESKLFPLLEQRICLLLLVVTHPLLQAEVKNLQKELSESKTSEVEKEQAQNALLKCRLNMRKAHLRYPSQCLRWLTAS